MTKAKAVASAAVAASLACSGAVIGATQSDHSLPEAIKTAHEQALVVDDGWVKASLAADEERKDQNKGEPDLGNLQPRNHKDGGDHGNEQSQEARENARDNDDREEDQGDERNESERVTLCHRTGSEKNPGVTISVSEHALDAHLRHGDERGECEFSQSERARGNRDARTEGRGPGHARNPKASLAHDRQNQH